MLMSITTSNSEEKGAKPHRVLALSDPISGHHSEHNLDYAICDFRKADAESAARGDRFPLDCRGCGIDHPKRRAVSTACGHVVCLVCTIGADNCPVCHVPANFVSLDEKAPFLRDCGVCCNKTSELNQNQEDIKKQAPLNRAFLSSCGHSLCCACALQLIPESHEDVIFCPFCHAESEIVVMVEKVVKNTFFRRFCQFVERIMHKLCV